MRPLVVVTGAYAAACAVGLRWPADAALTAAVLVVSIAAVMARPDARTLLGSIALIGLCAGAGRARAMERDCRARIPDGARIRAHGFLEGAVQRGGQTVLAADRIEAGGKVCRGNVRVRVAIDPPEPGAFVVVTGRWWRSPDRSVWPTDPARSGTLTVSRVEPSAGVQRLAVLRGAAQRRIRARFGASAGMVEAVLLARREVLDPTLRDAFAASGLSHLLAISGTHVGMIAAAVLLLARIARLRARAAALSSGIVTALYVLFLGAPHAAARAALQVLALVVARLVQRPSDPWSVLSFAALALLCVRPDALLDAGFQLSFAGVFGLLAFAPPIRRFLGSRAEPVVGTLAATAAATAATLPIAALRFGLVSWIGLATNLLAVPLLAVAVPAAALALLADVVHPAAGAFLAGGAAVPFAVLERLARAGAAVPGGHAYWGPGAVTATLLGGVAFILLRRTAAGGRTSRRPVLVAAAGAVVIATAPLPALRRNALEIHMIDVGQGDAIAVRTPGGHWILVDTGPRTDRFDAGLARVAPYLRDHGARRIEVLLLTHPDLDHIGGAPAILRALPVGILIDPALPAAKQGFFATIEAARSASTPWYAGRAGREIRIDQVTLEVLAPADSLLDGPADANDVSVVFRLSWGRFAALFTGDAPRAVENEIVESRAAGLTADLLKVGHHGSRTSTGDSLLDALHPKLALVSVGARNRYGHPAPGVLSRLERHGIRTLRTDEAGSIVVRVRANGTMTYTTER